MSRVSLRMINSPVMGVVVSQDPFKNCLSWQSYRWNKWSSVFHNSCAYWYVIEYSRRGCVCGHLMSLNFGN